MASRISPTRHVFSNDASPSVNPKICSAKLESKQRCLGKRVSRVLLLLTLFCIGVAATFAWQTYGHATTEMLANSFAQLGWWAPETAAVQSPDMLVPTAPAAPPSDWEHLKAISLGLAAMRQTIDQLAANQQQMATEIAKLQAIKQEIRDKIVSAPPRKTTTAPARKSAAQTASVR